MLVILFRMGEINVISRCIGPNKSFPIPTTQTVDVLFYPVLRLRWSCNVFFLIVTLAIGGCLTYFSSTVGAK